MNKQQIIEKFAGGFTVGDSEFPDNFLLDKANTKDNQLWLLAYDANLMPATPFATWNTKYRLNNGKRSKTMEIIVFLIMVKFVTIKLVTC